MQIKSLPRKEAGFSLVELMVAMLLGITLLGGTITVFTGGLRSSEFNQALSSLQANARFAVDVITTDVRMAGYQGCADPTEAPLQIGPSNAPTTNLAETAITGAVITSSGWSPAAPLGFTPPTGIGEPVVGTHALMVQYAASPGFRVTEDMSNPSDSLTVADTAGNDQMLYAGDLAVVSNCNSSDLFEVSSVGTGASMEIQPDLVLSQAYSLQSATDRTLRVMPFVSAVYYVGNTLRTNVEGDEIQSLYLQTYPYDDPNNPPIELIEGVDQMQLSFGQRAAGGNTQFMTPDVPGFDPTTVNSVRIGLLMSSVDRYTEANDNRTYTLANVTAVPAGLTTPTGAVVYPADKRLRIPFNTTISVRNRRGDT